MATSKKSPPHAPPKRAFHSSSSPPSPTERHHPPGQQHRHITTMMSSSTEPTPPLRSTVILYENERHWIGGGFSKKGLLPTERGPYSTADGSMSWRTVEEASEALLGRGWTYEDDDVYGFDRPDSREAAGGDGGGGDDDAVGEGTGNGGNGNGTDGGNGDGSSGSAAAEAGGGGTDGPGDDDDDDGWRNAVGRNRLGAGGSSSSCDDGWRYAVDFNPNALSNATPNRGPLHFVRRRRLVRSKIFDPDTLLPAEIRLKCDHCDAESVRTLSDKLLEVLSVATLLQRDSQQTLTDAVVVPIKTKLVDSLRIGSDLPAWLVKADPPTRLRRYVLTDLDRFPDTYAQSLKNLFRTRDEATVGLEDRMGEVAAKYFDREERDAIAALTVRRIDPEFFLHCDKVNCGEACEFCPEKCPNVGCGAVVSRRNLARHDENCGFKPVPCPNGCGVSPPRNGHKVHLMQGCDLRDAACPFKAMGCPAVVLAKDLAPHLTDGAGGHLLLVAASMEDYGKQLATLAGKVEGLEAENADLRRRLEERDDKAKREVGVVKKDVGKVGKEVASVQKEVARLRADLKRLERSHKK